MGKSKALHAPQLFHRIHAFSYQLVQDNQGPTKGQAGGEKSLINLVPASIRIMVFHGTFFVFNNGDDEANLCAPRYSTEYLLSLTNICIGQLYLQRPRRRNHREVFVSTKDLNPNPSRFAPTSLTNGHKATPLGPGLPQLSLQLH